MTGVIARIVMDRWARMFRKALKEANIEEHMIEKYVDDVNLVFEMIAQGYGWSSVGGKEIFSWTEDRMEKDSQENLLPEERTMARV